MGGNKMKTTQGKVTKAYIILSNIGARILPPNVAYSLYKVKCALKPTYDFYGEQEEKYIKELGGEITEIGGIVFPAKEKNAEFLEKRKELENMEVEIELEVPTIALNEMRETSIKELEALEGFVNFK